ncbi:ATP-binding cassette domain-containing protein [Novosphingobium piscinae]|uniref:ATP-binding cassette domain-containing protein n=1 Tax=Novosphingobium piscinae TaxID=1507448 RepID=A0A7X1FZ42_9SPHN|nr:ATP-binding cassette domain-containing protein [Novosphingobium piscinae]MBC2669664.1 ATP-binding cassette domain-containing protein [Novosphingobium piscinae]
MPGEAFLDAAWWPLTALAEALEALAGAHGLAPATPVDSAAGDNPPADELLNDWLHWAAARCDLEAVPVQTPVRELRAFMLHGAPAIVRLDRGCERGFLALTGQRGGQPLFLTPPGQRLRIRCETVEALLIRELVEPLQPEIVRVLDAAGITPTRRARVSTAMVCERIGGEPVGGLTLLRLPPGAAFTRQARQAGLHLRLSQIVGLFVLLYGAELWSWQLIGGATINGRLDWGWLAAWALLAFTMLPGRLLAGWVESLFALDFGRLLKARLLAGALALPPDAVKRRGVGAMIGQVMEAQALEGMALAGTFGVLVGMIELGFAAWVLRLGAAPVLHTALLALFAALTILLGLHFHRRIMAWTRQRLGLTDYLVEAMIGHRTRLAQERPPRRDATEDALQASYFGTAQQMDSATLQFGSGLGLAWNLLGLAALAPALAGAAPPGASALAISLGGLMLAQRALGGIGGGLSNLSRARFAWREVATIFRAGLRPERPGLPVDPRAPKSAVQGPVLEVRGLRYRHEGASTPVLQGVDLAIAAGDRILIEGPSGGGKSTLANVLTGLRPAQQGLLLLDGLDPPTLGDSWHARITAAPQFHENHILSGTLAFNLLMGRQWPPSEADLAEAHEVCEELGLGDLLRRMPGGLHQRVGETGWQLSHGERSRVFLARALLQRAAVTILDESFASLDPATMDRCLDTALKRAETLVVIAHP